MEIQEGLRWKRHIDHLWDRESSTSTSDLESADADAFVTAPFSDANAETEHDSTESISPTEPTYVDTLFVLGIHQIDLCDFFFNIGFVVVCFCYLFVSTFIVFKWGGV